MPEPAAVLAELTRFARALTGALRRETVAQCTVEALERIFPGAGCAVATVEEGSRRIAVIAARGEAAPDAGDAVIAEVLRTRAVARADTPPTLAAPMVAAGHTMGIAAVRGHGTPFGAADEAVVGAVAAQAAIALQNTRLIEMLGAAKHEWEQMVDAIRPAIAILDGAGTIRRANRAFADLVGSPVTALTGRPWLMLLPPAWAEAVERAIGSPGGEGGEIRTDKRTFAVRAHAVTTEAGTVVLLIEDVTDTKRLQEQLIQSEKLSAIGQLIAGVAHELNNPLASVLGFADFLAESGQTPPALLEPVRIVQHEAQRAAGIVKNLLTFARRQDQERRRVEIGPVVQRTLQLLNNQLMGMKVTADVTIEPGLPAIEGSPNQLQQVFVNLVNNAAQAIAGTGREGTVTVRVRPWLDGVAVDVADDGPGMPEDLQARIFEPFFSTKPEGEGTGLGLSICVGIVKEHDGRITVRSAPGQGATFTVELPGAGRAPAAEAPAGGAGAAGARVLVVDDEPHILYYMRATLEAWGHTVETASDGADALQRSMTGAFDLIITDVRMPRLGGREFFERLRAERPEAARRVIFATGDTVRDDTMAFIERSGQPFLHKPFKLAELRSTLAAALDAVR